MELSLIVCFWHEIPKYYAYCYDLLPRNFLANEEGKKSVESESMKLKIRCAGKSDKREEDFFPQL